MAADQRDSTQAFQRLPLKQPLPPRQGFPYPIPSTADEPRHIRERASDIKRTAPASVDHHSNATMCISKLPDHISHTHHNKQERQTPADGSSEPPGPRDQAAPQRQSVFPDRARLAAPRERYDSPYFTTKTPRRHTAALRCTLERHTAAPLTPQPNPCL
ncbi:hypothetical protein AOLI_G00280170 [Acnodon oligacanthus]